MAEVIDIADFKAGHHAPTPKPEQDPAPPFGGEISAADIIRGVLQEEGETIERVLILKEHKDGNLGFAGNLDDKPYTDYFMRKFQFLLMKSEFENPSGSPKGTA